MRARCGWRVLETLARMMCRARIRLAHALCGLRHVRRLARWDEVGFGVADQIAASHGMQGVADHRPVVRVVIA